MTPMEYNPNGKDIMAPMEKTCFYERLFLEVVIVMVKDKKTQYKRYSVKKNLFSFIH